MRADNQFHRFVRALVLGALLTVLGSPVWSDSEDPPSVLFVMIDTLRADHCSSYGYARETTKHLDALAAQGVRFANAYAPTAVTGPSTFTMFTSLYPRTHGCMENGVSLPDDIPTVPEIFAAAGYQTYGIASSPTLAGKRGFGRGFEVYDDTWPLEESSPVEPGTKRPDYISVVHSKSKKDGQFYLKWDRRPEHTAAHALEWIQSNRDPNRPLFAFVHFMDPHEPTTPPERFLRKFRDPGAPESDKGSEFVQFLIDLYDAEVQYVDNALGHLVAGMKQLVPEEELLVVVVADHGQGLFQHGWYAHAVHLYEEQIHVPLVLSWPGRIESKRTITAPVELVDLAPTLLELAGIDAGERDLHGTSLVGAIDRTEQLDPHRPVFAERRFYEVTKAIEVSGDVPGRKFAVRHGDWKYIASPEAGKYELFNLQMDPDEQVNVLEDHPQKHAEMQGLLERWQRERPSVESEEQTLSPEDREALRALGYGN